MADDRLLIAGVQGASAHLLGVKINANGAMALESRPTKTDQTTIRQLIKLKDQSAIYSLGFSDKGYFLGSWPQEKEERIFTSNQIDPMTLGFVPGPEIVIAAYGEQDGLLYI
ncbi:MAG: hypothetical protein ACK55I_01875, partial [bacterium]